MTSRPATAMEIATNIIATASNAVDSREAQIRVTNVAKVANGIFDAGGIQNDSDPEKLHGRILREYVRRPYLFLPPDCNFSANVLAMQELEFENVGDRIELRRKPRDRKGAR